jgi:hypothetical protein
MRQLMRPGAMGRVFTTERAPTTLCTFLPSAEFGHDLSRDEWHSSMTVPIAVRTFPFRQEAVGRSPSTDACGRSELAADRVVCPAYGSRAGSLRKRLTYECVRDNVWIFVNRNDSPRRRSR